MNIQDWQTWQERQTSLKAMRIFLCMHSFSGDLSSLCINTLYHFGHAGLLLPTSSPEWRQCAATAASFRDCRTCRQSWATLSLQMTLFTRTPLLLCWKFPRGSRASKGAPQTHPGKGICVQLVWNWTVLTLEIFHQNRLSSAHLFDCTWWRAGWDPCASGWLQVGTHSNIFRWQSWGQKGASAFSLGVVTLCLCTHLPCKSTCLNQFWVPVLSLPISYYFKQL